MWWAFGGGVLVGVLTVVLLLVGGLLWVADLAEWRRPELEPYE
jgi:hypothetical protein